jgi:hypothetical protein
LLSFFFLQVAGSVSIGLKALLPFQAGHCFCLVFSRVRDDLLLVFSDNVEAKEDADDDEEDGRH